jgi:hypothetical protein
MNISPDMSVGLRHCALALHALHPIDREWVLDRLEGRAVQDLRRLLAELSELGLPREASIVKQALTPQAEDKGQDVEALAAALSSEPLRLVAIAVGDIPERRRDAVLQRMGLASSEELMNRLQEQRRMGSTAPRLKEAIGAALRERVEAATPARQTSRWMRAWRPWRGGRV